MTSQEGADRLREELDREDSEKAVSGRAVVFVVVGIVVVAILLLLVAPLAVAQDEMTVQGFGGVGADVDRVIEITGPDAAVPAQEVTFRLSGTPTLDLALPLVTQLEWLMGEDRMFAWLAIPNQPIVPIDVRGELVFAAAGATMQPLIRFTVGEPGTYRILVDWNYKGPDGTPQYGNQLAEHTLNVEGEQRPDPPTPDPPTPDPPVPPLSSLHVQIVLEQDDMMEGVEGMRFSNLVEEIKAHLSSLPCQWQSTDKDQPAASRYLTDLTSDQTSLPALAVYARQQTDSKPSRFIGAVSLAGGDVDTIRAELAELGVRK